MSHNKIKRVADVVPTQRSAITEATKHVSDGGRVQVFGEPDMRLSGERFCTEEDGDQVVIYHRRVAYLSSGGHTCLDCGATDVREPDGASQ